MSILRRIAALIASIYFLVVGISNGDYIYTIIGSVLALWFILDFLSREFKVFEMVQAIYGIIVGICISVFGVIGAIVEKDSVFFLFVLFGLLIILNYLIPIIIDYRNRKTNKDSSNISSTLK